MPVEAVLVDLGGVWLQERDFSARHQWATSHGLTAAELGRRYVEAIGPGWEGGRTEDEIQSRLMRACGVTNDELPALLEALHAHEELDEELTAYLCGLRPWIRTGVISNAGPSAREAMCRRFGLDQFVDVIVVSAEEGVSKPHPAIYRAAAGRLGVPAENCVFIDDKEANVEGARAVGMHGRQFSSIEDTISELARLLDQP